MAHNDNYTDDKQHRDSPEQWGQYAHMLREAPVQQMPPGFTERIERKVQAEIAGGGTEPIYPKRASRLKAVSALAVATIMVVIGINRLGVLQNQPQPKAEPVVNMAPQVQVIENHVILPELTAVQVDTLIPEILPPGAIDPIVPGSIEAARQEVVYEQYLESATEPVVPGLPYIRNEH